MTLTLHIAKSFAIAKLCDPSKAGFFASLHNAGMATPLHFLREWREFKGWTQEELAQRVGTSGAVISLLESGAYERPDGGRVMGLSAKWAHRLGKAMGIRPGVLLDVDPNMLPTDILRQITEIEDDAHPQVARILDTFPKKKAG